MNQTKDALIAEIVQNYPTGRDDWARFYRSWTKEALRRQLDRITAARRKAQRAADATGLAQPTCLLPGYDTQEAVREVSPTYYHCCICGRYHPTHN